MARGDLNLPTFICLKCRRKRQRTLDLPTNAVICSDCQDLASTQDRHLATVKTIRKDPLTNHRTISTVTYRRKRNEEFPHSHYFDRNWLQANGGESIYLAAHDKRHGRCSRCQIWHPTLRIVPAINGRKIRTLVCSNCLKDNPKRPSIPKPKPRHWTLELLQHADPLVRTILYNNPQFIQECLTQEQTPATLELELEQVPALE